MLSPHERARADAIANPAARTRFVIGRAALRRLAAAVLGADAHVLRLGTGPHGQPLLLAYPRSGASVSATIDRAVVGIAPTTRWLGIDIERLDREPIPPPARWCSARERALLARTPGSHRCDLGLRLWTGKEAVVKALGTGMATPLAEVEVYPTVHHPEVPDDALDWPDLGIDHRVAVAIWR